MSLFRLRDSNLSSLSSLTTTSTKNTSRLHRLLQIMDFRGPRMPLQDITPPRGQQDNFRNGRPRFFTNNEENIEFYDIRRWMFLFGYSQSQAFRRIKEFRCKPPTFLLPDHHWNLVKEDMMSQGYDKEAYAFLYNQQQMKNRAKNTRRIAREALKELARTKDLLIDSEELLHDLQLTMELEVLFSKIEEIIVNQGSFHE